MTSALCRWLAGWLDPLLRRPLLCLTVLWAAGILLALRVPWDWQPWAWAALPALVLAIFTLGRPHPLAHVPLYAAVLAVAAALCAWQSAEFARQTLPPGAISVAGYPLAEPQRAEQGWRVRFRLVTEPEMSDAGEVSLFVPGAPPEPGCYYRCLGKVRPAEAPGNPFGFDPRGILQQQQLRGEVLATRLTPLPTPAPVPPVFRLRAQLDRRLAATMPAENPVLFAELLDSLVLGYHGTSLPAEIVDDFRAAGTIHLIIASGNQVMLLGGLLLWPLGLLPYGAAPTSYPRLRLWLLPGSLLVLAGYVLLADRGPAIDRAFLVLLGGMLALILRLSPLGNIRSFRPDGLTLLAAAACLLFATNSALLCSPGWQLTFCAVFGVLTITPVLLRVLRPWLGVLAAWPAYTLGAQLLMYPVLAWHFGTVPLLAPITNLLAIPIDGLLLPLGLLAMAGTCVAPPFAVACNAVNLPLMRLLLAMNTAVAHCPWAESHQVIRSPWPIIGYLALLGLSVRMLSWWADRNAEENPISAGSTPRMW